MERTKRNTTRSRSTSARTSKSTTTRKATASSSSSSASGSRFNLLTYLNIAAGVLLIAQAVLIVVLRKGQFGAQQITTGYVAKDALASDQLSRSVLSPASHHLFDLNLAYIVAAFLIVGGLGCLLVSLYKRAQYEQGLLSGYNKFRWPEFAISSALIIATLAMMVGVSDISFLVLLMLLTVVAAMTNGMVEKRVQFQTRWPLLLGSLAGLATWVVILVYVLGAVIHGSGLPVYLWAILASTFILFLIYGANLRRQAKMARPAENYRTTEMVYLAVGFILKTALAWQIFASVLR
jgi:uncharacterized membrane protein